MSTTVIVEPFAEYRRRGGVPTLRARKHHKTMSVEWNDCGLIWGHDEFKSAVDFDAMNAELRAVWLRCKPQCDRRASFGYGRSGGYMGCVPIAAGVEAMAVIREHFAKALGEIADSAGPGRLWQRLTEGGES
jgi:hypothetical protein